MGKSASKQALKEQTNPSSQFSATPEYRTIVQCNQMLVDLLKQSVNPIGSALFAKGYISSSVRDYLRMETVNPTVKAVKLLDCLTDRIKHDAETYHEFIQILENEKPWTDLILESLSKAFQCHTTDIEPSLSTTETTVENTETSVISIGMNKRVLQPGTAHVPQSITAADCAPLATIDPQTENTDRVPSFICPCGNCSIEAFFSGSGCSKQCSPEIKQSLFPYLDTSTLCEEDKEELEDRLSSGLRGIIYSFARFKSSTIESFENQRTPISKLVDYVLSLGMFVADIGCKTLAKEDEGNIQKAQCIMDVFSTLRPYISFFNYDILEQVVVRFGSPKDNVNLEEYVAAFQQFCKRSVFEVPPNVFNQSSRQATDKVLTVKCRSEVCTTLESVVVVRRKIAQILDIKTCNLRLCSIEKGCVQLQFLIPSLIADRIIPISPLNETSLNQIGVRILEQYRHSLLIVKEQNNSKEVKASPIASSQANMQPVPATQVEQRPLITMEIESLPALLPSLKSQSLSASQVHHAYSPEMELVDACERGNVSEVESLLDQAVDVNSKDLRGRSNLTVACAKGYLQIVKLLIRKGATVSEEDQAFGRSALTIACEHGNLTLVEFLIEKGANVKGTVKHAWSPLQAACHNGHSDIANLLIQKGADVHQIDEWGRTLLTAVCCKGDFETAEVLMKNGAPADTKDQCGKSPLMVACEGGHLDIAMLLIDKGAHVNEVDESGLSPILVAYGRGHSKIVKLLIDSGADLEVYHRCFLSADTLPSDSVTPEQGIPTTVFDYSTRRSNLGVLKIAASAKYRGIPSASSGYGSATSGYSSASSGCRSEISGYSSASSGYRSEISGYSSALRFPTSSQKSSDSHPEGSDAVLSNKRVLNPPVQFQYHSDKQVKPHAEMVQNSEEIVKMVMDSLMHNRNCRIPNCPCYTVRKRYSHFFAPKQNTEPLTGTQSDPMTDRRLKLHLPLTSDAYDADDEYMLHPHYHLSHQTRPKRVHPKVKAQRRRSKSLDLTPVLEVPDSPTKTPVVGGTLLAETPVITNYTCTLGDGIPSHYDPNGEDCHIDGSCRLLRDISISADNLPTLCLNDCPFTPSPMRENRALKVRPPVNTHSHSKLAGEKSLLSAVEESNTSQIQTLSNSDRSYRSASPAYSTMVTLSDDGSVLLTTEC